MKRPQDFPKSLAVLTAMSAVLFIVPPAIRFPYLGHYATAPAFGSLGIVAYKKASFAFVIVPTLVIAVIYANEYGCRVGSVGSDYGWDLGHFFVFAEVVPSMGDFLSLLGAAFDSFFGFILFAVAYWQIYKGGLFAGAGGSIMAGIHAIAFLCGLFLLGPGLYSAVEAIIADYSGSTTPTFSCANVAI
ncbi:uncharacterized protein CDV56_102439 [Aspergillus thermomutatus]|uniref:Amino acid transporter transmembrane domain-containing protein n=1 Tax=Aspergillus thermomutatus TaxID=41047 RepID=A0A397G2J9_ASPTH|nr:uncharacterized protein CDV56_102439 [Aspergillus thermomutatus]RHZ44847.1 hypothetical protein CDV56_102439 [Aspergillus thermomutatus]